MDVGEHVLLGRSMEAAIVFPSLKVSRRHAKVVGTADGWWVTDVRSSTGTFVNDERLVEPRLLVSGDMIRIGDVLVLFLS